MNLKKYFIQEAPEHVATHERRQLKWFLGLVILVLLLSIVSDIIIGIYEKPNDTKPTPNPKPTQIVELISPTIPTQPSPTKQFSTLGQSCGKNAGAGGNAQCAQGLTCYYTSLQEEAKGVGVCRKK